MTGKPAFALLLPHRTGSTGIIQSHAVIQLCVFHPMQGKYPQCASSRLMAWAIYLFLAVARKFASPLCRPILSAEMGGGDLTIPRLCSELILVFQGASKYSRLRLRSTSYAGTSPREVLGTHLSNPRTSPFA